MNKCPECGKELNQAPNWQFCWCGWDNMKPWYEVRREIEAEEE